jgi:murein DD-endopeptidase MepM/ murein hydrolase activator NlpD
MAMIFAVEAVYVALVLVWLAALRPATKPRAFVSFVAAVLALMGAGLVGIWLYPPLQAMALLAAVAVLLVGVRNWRRAGSANASTSAQRVVQDAGVAAWAVLGGVLIWQGVTGRITPAGEMFDLAAPLDRGAGYCVVSGGAAPLLNFHYETLAPGKHTFRGQSYGVDFVACGPFGQRTTVEYWLHPSPRSPVAYRIFGAEVRAPCAGEVVAAHDGMADQEAGVIDRARMAGNHVVLRCDGHDVLLAHLRQGSVAVSLGQRVEIGARLGEVGNTGASDEPHLHVSVQRGVDQRPSFGGAPMHITFDGAFVARGGCL